MEPYLGKGCTVFMNNYYSSPYLFYNLQLNDTGACGTVRARKGLPKGIMDAKFKAHNEMKVMHYGDEMIAMKILDRKHVNFDFNCF